MSDLEQAVFVSYGWGGESEQIVNQVDQALQARGIRIVRDKRDLGYKGSISEFMERIGRGMCVIVVISDKYLRSPNCMFELVEIAKNKDFYDRVFPIVLGDADIYKPVNIVKYVKYWEDQIKELDEAMKTVGSANLKGVRDDIDSYTEIRAWIAELASTFKNMNTLTPDMHRESAFNAMYTAIGKRLKESAGSAVPESAQEALPIEPYEPETILVPKGPFLMGSQQAEGIPQYETPRQEVILPAYRIGKYPVTNAQYEAFATETRRNIPPIMGWGGQSVPIGKENYPVVGVTWRDTHEYCEWLKGKTGKEYILPTEAQWEKACRGGADSFYPWGNEFDPTRCNQGGAELAPVDAFPAQSQYGFDFVGNIRQWTATLWGENRFTPDPRYAYNKGQLQGPNNSEAGDHIRRVLRGSSMKDDVKFLRCSARSGQLPKERGQLDRDSQLSILYGFRVAMNIKT